MNHRKVYTDEKEWGEFLDELFADRQVSEHGGALPRVSQRELEQMEAPL